MTAGIPVVLSVSNRIARFVNIRLQKKLNGGWILLFQTENMNCPLQVNKKIEDYFFKSEQHSYKTYYIRFPTGFLKH